MSAPSDDDPAGWLTQFRRGVVSGVAVLLVAVVLTAIPTFLAWLAPGTESTRAGSALRAAVIATIAANHGGIVLDGTGVTLVPLLPTLLLGWLLAARARKPETGLGFAGLVLGYAAATGVAAAGSTLGTTRAPVLASVLAAALISATIGAAARYGPVAWTRLDERWHRIVRAAAGAMASYLLVASVLAAVMVTTHLRLAETLQGSVASGGAGLPVAVIGIAAAPNAVAAVLGYLTGPGFAVGAHTSVSAFSIDRGRLPTFPLLAGLPTGQAVPVLGVALGLVTALAAGFLLVRLVADPALSTGAVASDLVLASLGAGLAATVLVTLAEGSLGPGSLHHVGAVGWQVGGASALLLMVSAGLWLAASALRRRLSGHGAAAGPQPRVSLTKAGQPAQRAKAARSSAATADGGTARGGETVGTSGRRLKGTG
jgi:hypothetical protein